MRFCDVAIAASQGFFFGKCLQGQKLDIKKQLMYFSCFFVVHPGLEPRLADPESDVLPLHQWTMLVFPFESGCKSTNFFAIDKVFFDNIFLCADCQ